MKACDTVLAAWSTGTPTGPPAPPQGSPGCRGLEGSAQETYAAIAAHWLSLKNAIVELTYFVTFHIFGNENEILWHSGKDTIDFKRRHLQMALWEKSMCPSTGFPRIKGARAQGPDAGTVPPSHQCPVLIIGPVLPRLGLSLHWSASAPHPGASQGQGLHRTDVPVSLGLVQGLTQ